MNHMLTLVCHPDNPVVTPALVRSLADIVDISSPVSLAEDVAVDIPVESSDLSSLELKIRDQLADAPIDVIIQPVKNRAKKLLIADMDSTIIEQECLDELAAFAGLKEEVSEITERAMRGELDFEEALRARVRMLKDLPTTKLQETLSERISLMSGAATLVQTMNKRDAMTALVSGGFTFFTHRIAQAVGFQDNQGNILETDQGLLTGEVESPILGREAKLEALEMHCENEGISLEYALAVGDGANDLAMLGAAGTGVAYHAKPAVAEAAKVRIDHSDLTALLYLQGIPKTEFVSA